MSERISAFVVLAAFAAGCGSDDEARVGDPAATTSAPSLAGTYERTLTHADIDRTDHLRDESAPGQEQARAGPAQARARATAR